MSVTDEPFNPQKEWEKERELLQNWRHRRLKACCAVDTLRAVIEHLGEDGGQDLPPDGGLPLLHRRTKGELQNLAAVLLRQILIANDGNVSPQKLQCF